jgi:hypothetical protein
MRGFSGVFRRSKLVALDVADIDDLFRDHAGAGLL